MITMSSPINLEDQVGEAANFLGIPVVALSDYWGGLTRAKKAKADLMLAIDLVDDMTIRHHLRTKTGAGTFGWSHKFETAIVGNHAVNKARSLAPSNEIKQKMREFINCFNPVILFAGGGTDYTSAEIKLLVACLQKTPGAWVVIKRYHGEHMNRTAPDGRTYREIWDEQFAPLKNGVLELTTDEGDAVAAIADCTISGFSTMMTTAVASFQSAIALVTPETRSSLKAQTTLDRHPLSTMGLVLEVDEPRDLNQLVFHRKPARDSVNAALKPYDPALALAEIEKLLK